MCNNGNCLAELLEKILIIQQNENQIIDGCSNVSLLNNNTRPITLYCCCTNDLWTMPYNYDGNNGVTSVFRIESINDNCATFRMLIPGNDSYLLTDNFFTINLNYVSCIKCLSNQIIQKK